MPYYHIYINIKDLFFLNIFSYKTYFAFRISLVTILIKIFHKKNIFKKNNFNLFLLKRNKNILISFTLKLLQQKVA